MDPKFAKYKSDVDRLSDFGRQLLNAMRNETRPKEFRASLELKWKEKKQVDKILRELPDFKAEYQGWYSESLSLLKQMLPDRVADFVKLFEKPKGRKEIQYGNYVIEDYLQGLALRNMVNEIKVGPEAAFSQMEQQWRIVSAVQRRFESSLFDIRQLVQADLFDNELEAAKELAKNKFHRAAGAMAGVVLERHLAQVAVNHNFKVAKKHPSIADWNDLLKQNGSIEMKQWRTIQLLGDLRNLCDHNKQNEPTADDIDTLISGVEKVIKTVF